MDLSKEQQANISLYEQLRQQAGVINAQKNQLSVQKAASEYALSELDKTKEDHAYRAVGSVLVKLSTDEVKKELNEELKEFSENLESLEVQEKKVIERMQKLKTQIESALKQGKKDE